MLRWPPLHAAGLLALGLSLSLALGVRAVQAKDSDEVTEPSDPDFAAQGEYVGDVLTPRGEMQIGVQVVALGGGKFLATNYMGGLPGDGWDRSKRTENTGEMKDGAVIFRGDNYSTSVKDDLITIFLNGVKYSELKKIHRESKTLGAAPPPGAVVLFDGTSASHFEGGQMSEDHLLLPGCTSKEKFGSGTLHVEFRVPFMPDARKQKRGKSGVYLQGRYEVQILDSFGEKEVNYGCGAIVSLKTPEINMCYPPESWQTFDIDFRAAEYEHGKKIKDPFATIKLNHEIVARKVTLRHASPDAPVAVGEEPGPFFLQDSGDAVRFRNIWFLKEGADTSGKAAAK